MILICSCKHEYQDKKYGKYRRVHTYATSAFNKTGGWRCTVCKNERDE